MSWDNLFFYLEICGLPDLKLILNRALLLSQNGDTKDDFRIEFTDHSIHVLNAPSPAATACLAIGGQITDMAKKHFEL